MWYHTHIGLFFFLKRSNIARRNGIFWKDKIGVNIERDLNDLSNEAKSTFPFAVSSYRVTPRTRLWLGAFLVHQTINF